MTALRLARAFTKRDKVIKFAGGYHGHGDGLLVKGGSGLATLGIPDSAGVPPNYAENTLVAPYNNVKAVRQILELYPKQIAAIIVEPITANMGVVLPKPGFLEGLRQLTHKSGALLIFDEVITGFRVGYGGAQALYGVTPDLTCLGKIIGGGLPVGAYGGKREIMEMIAPLGPVYQAGTLSGNPLAMTAGIETLRILHRPESYRHLEARSASLEEAVIKAAAKAGIDLHVSRMASLFTIFFSSTPVIDYESASRANTALFSRFFQQLLSAAIYWPPSQFEAAFLSLSHSDEDIKLTTGIIERVLNQLGRRRSG
jgi:glutamate-1-semialdehyde 2,1-aminomutase